MPFHRDPVPPSLRSDESELRETAPYSVLAKFYDGLMWHVDYVQWADYLIRITERFSVPKGLWCEGGCGTGNIALRIARFKIPVCGFDISSEMIEVANWKAQQQKLQIPFSVADFRSFSAHDLAYLFVVYDGLNYLLDPSEIEHFLVLAEQAILPGGILVFDLCTERNSTRNLNNWYDHQRREGYEYRRHSWYDESTQVHHNDFEVRFMSNPGVLFEEKHQQRVYSIEAAKMWILRSSFKLLAILGDVTFSPGTEKNDRVHFVLRKL